MIEKALRALFDCGVAQVSPEALGMNSRGCPFTFEEIYAEIVNLSWARWEQDSVGNNWIVPA